MYKLAVLENNEASETEHAKEWRSRLAEMMHLQVEAEGRHNKIHRLREVYAYICNTDYMWLPGGIHESIGSAIKKKTISLMSEPELHDEMFEMISKYNWNICGAQTKDGTQCRRHCLPDDYRNFLCYQHDPTSKWSRKKYKCLNREQCKEIVVLFKEINSPPS